MRLSREPLIRSEAIQRRVAELAREISADFAGHELAVVVVLKGAMFFAADLTRQLRVPVEIEFVRARSYTGTDTVGTVELTLVPEQPLAGRNVLVVEDILDTGRTASAIIARLMAEGPARLSVCTLLDKPSRREVPVPGAYIGFTIDNHFVVGYGLDYEERYRHLPDIWILETGGQA